METRGLEYGGVWQVPDRAPLLVEAAILTETTEELFRDLDPDDRLIVECLLQGYNGPDQIATRARSLDVRARVRRM